MYEFELGGFAEELSDIDGTIEEFNAFNYCLAESYVGAMYDEDFESLGEFSPSLLNNICAWYNYDESMKNQEETNEIKTGKLITKNNRTFIDAIYANKSATVAEAYLLNGVFSPKLVLTIILNESDEYIARLNCYSEEDYDKKIKEIHDFIEIEYEKSDNKIEFLNKIKNNYSRINVAIAIFKPKKIPSTYNWVKQLKNMSK